MAYNRCLLFTLRSVTTLTEFNKNIDSCIIFISMIKALIKKINCVQVNRDE